MCVYRFAIILSADDYRTPIIDRTIIGTRLSVSHPLPVPNEEWYWLIWRSFYENQKPLKQRFVRYYNHEKKKYQRFTVWKFRIYRVWPLFWDTYFSQFLYQIQKFITFLRMYKNLHVLSILKWYCNVVNYQKWPVCITFCDAGQIAKNTHSRIKFIAIFQSLFVRYVYKSLVFWIAQIISFLKWCRKRM